MAHQRDGQRNKARDCLERADQALAAHGNPGPMGFAGDWIIYKIVREEAERLILGESFAQ